MRYASRTGGFMREGYDMPEHLTKRLINWAAVLED
jgi:hypothetical protein